MENGGGVLQTMQKPKYGKIWTKRYVQFFFLVAIAVYFISISHSILVLRNVV